MQHVGINSVILCRIYKAFVANLVLLAIALIVQNSDFQVVTATLQSAFRPGQSLFVRYLEGLLCPVVHTLSMNW